MATTDSSVSAANTDTAMSTSGRLNSLSSEDETSSSASLMKMRHGSKIPNVDKEGCLLWAKLKGYSYWPGIVTVDPVDGKTVKYTEQIDSLGNKRRRVHVHFLGYDNMRAWVPEAQLLEYIDKATYDHEASRYSQAKKKDYYPTKRYQKPFDMAIDTAEETAAVPIEDRLEKLGLVYVLIDHDAATATVQQEESKVNDKSDTVKEKTVKAPRKRKSSTKPGDGGTPGKKRNRSPKAKAAPALSSRVTTKKAPSLLKPPGAVSATPSSKPAHHQHVINKQQSTESESSEKTGSFDPYEFSDNDENPPPLCVDISKPSKLTTTKPKLKSTNAIVEAPLVPLVSKTKTPTGKAAKTRKPSGNKSKANNKISNGNSPPPTVRVSTPDADLIQDIMSTTNIDDDSALAKLLESDTDEDQPDTEPKLGSLIWGRMAGFPYWPCFVTQSPEGEFRKDHAKRGGINFHVQFFNWNDESAWVTSFMPWCPIDEYQSKAKTACPKGPNTPEGKTWYPPVKLVAKWKGAVIEAQKTAKMSRRERYEKHVVFYHHPSDEELLEAQRLGILDAPKQILTAAAKKQLPSSTPKPKSKKQRKRSSSSTNSQKSTEKQEQQQQQMEPVKKRRRSKSTTTVKKVLKPEDRPCPASKKKKKPEDPDVPVDNVNDRQPKRKSEYQLPQGWTHHVVQGQGEETAVTKDEFHSPEGSVYQSLNEAIARLMQQNCGPPSRSRSYTTSDSDQIKTTTTKFGWFLESTDAMHFRLIPYTCDESAGAIEGPVEYLRDESLPPNWSVRKVQRDPFTWDYLYQPTQQQSDKKDIKFTSKVAVARFVEGMGHPAVEIEQILHNFPNLRDCLPKDPDNQFADNDNDDSNHSDDNMVTTIVLTEWSVEDVGQDPVLAKTVIPCYCDMVKLPDVFLEHPVVRVRDSESEMVITDFYTGDFIAKKIIYD